MENKENKNVPNVAIDVATENSTSNLEIKLDKASNSINEATTNFQECAQLEIEDVYSKSTNTLADLMNLQKTLQEDLFGHNFEEIQSSIGKLKAFCDWNEEAIRDEQREFAAAITGIHTFAGHWKPWKSKHKEAMSRPLSALTEEELLELQYEMVDQLHFFLNMIWAVKLTPEKLFNMYYAKNKENIARQKRVGGY